MNRPAFGTALFFLLAPGTVAGVIPWWITRWEVLPAHWALRLTGLALLLCALPILVDSFVRFAREGLGTPAPVVPTKHLVVSGWYRYVRNPMYVAVVSAVLGQGLLLGQTVLLGYGAGLWLLFHLFVTSYEERVLHRTYGAEYDHFVARVPRWIPKLPSRS